MATSGNMTGGKLPSGDLDGERSVLTSMDDHPTSRGAIVDLARHVLGDEAVDTEC